MAAAGTLPKWLADTDAAHFKALLYMFFACHIIFATGSAGYALRKAPKFNYKVFRP